MPASKPRRVRWECPNGKHPGVLGSTRPPRDSIVRYCLPCSQDSGRLVERVAPALERQRAQAKAAAAAKAKKARERAAAARAKAAAKEAERYTVEGVDLRHEMGCLLRLKAWNGFFGRPGPDGGFHNRPELVISRRSTTPTRLGYAEPWRNRITIATYPGQTLADARETLVHELTHLVVGSRSGSRPGTRSWHGPEFRQTMTKAFKEAYKVLPLGVPDNRYHGRYAAALARKEAREKQAS